MHFLTRPSQGALQRAKSEYHEKLLQKWILAVLDERLWCFVHPPCVAASDEFQGPSGATPLLKGVSR